MKTIIERFLEKYSYLEKYGMYVGGLFLGEIKNESEELSCFVGEAADDLCVIKENEKHSIYLNLNHPFVFDNRLVPKEFEGIKVRNIIVGGFPEEFDVDENDNRIPIEVYYAPEKYIRFVERCFDEIRIKLDNPKMTKEEMLDALTFEGNFSEHVQNMEELRIERIIGKK